MNMNLEIATTLFISGAFTFPALFLVQLYLWNCTERGLQLQTKYGFSRKDVTDISNKVVSAFQAILCALSGFLICLACYEDVMYDTSPVTLVYSYFGIPYFLYDTISMFFVYELGEREKRGTTMTKDKLIKQPRSIREQIVNFFLHSPVMIFHHIFLAPLGFSLIAFFRDGIHHGDFFVGVVYMMEASTPFVSVRSILSMLKMKSSLLYVINGVLMLVTFPFFRLVTVFFAVAMYASQNSVGYFETLWMIPFGWKIVFFLAVAPQVYWCVVMWRSFLRMLKSTSPEYSAVNVHAHAHAHVHVNHHNNKKHS